MNAIELLAAASRIAGDRPLLEVAIELAGQAQQLDDVLARLAGAVRFAATIEEVGYEASSTRALVTVRAGADQDPEQLRTDRTDSEFGLVVARRAKRLVGRRCLVHKLVEDAGPGKRVRVLVWLDDLDTEPPA